MKILRGCIGQGEHLEANVESDWHGGDRGRITHLLHLVPVRIPAAAFRTICSLLMVCSGRLAKKALMWFKLSEREEKKKKRQEQIPLLLKGQLAGTVSWCS